MKTALMRERAEKIGRLAGHNIVDVDERVVQRHFVARLAGDDARLATNAAVEINRVGVTSCHVMPP